MLIILEKYIPVPSHLNLWKKLIRFFSKENELVFDPFCGVGGTLLGASLCNRRAIGIDLNNDYLNIYQEASNFLNLTIQTTIHHNSKFLDKIEDLKKVEFDLILTDPPYGDMMARKKTGEAAKKKYDTSPTPFTDSKEDIGNLDLEE